MLAITPAVVVGIPIAAVLYMAPPPALTKILNPGTESEAEIWAAQRPRLFVRLYKCPSCQQIGPPAKGEAFHTGYMAWDRVPSFKGIYTPHTTTNGAPDFINGLNHLYYDGRGRWVIGTRLGEIYSAHSSSIYYSTRGTTAHVPSGTYFPERSISRPHR